MKAAVLNPIPGRLDIEDMEIGEPGPREVLIRTAAAGLRTDMPRFVDIYLDGRLQLDEMVSKTITLDEINDGFADMKTGNVARSVILFD